MDERKEERSMEQQKIGSFLKELRKEKNLTQEQLAEKLNVSGRTVSRWETGTNMPDISLLVELAEFYEVSIPEIIDGERKSENMNEEVKETALKLSDYVEMIKLKTRKRLFWLTIVALIGMIAFVIIEASGLDTPGSVYEKIASAGLGIDFGMLIVLVMYLSGLLEKVKAERAMKEKNKHYTRVYQMVFGTLCCFIGIVFSFSQVNKTSGCIWLVCGCIILLHSGAKYYFYKKKK